MKELRVKVRFLVSILKKKISFQQALTFYVDFICLTIFPVKILRKIYETLDLNRMHKEEFRLNCL